MGVFSICMQEECTSEGSKRIHFSIRISLYILANQSEADFRMFSYLLVSPNHLRIWANGSTYGPMEVSSFELPFIFSFLILTWLESISHPLRVQAYCSLFIALLLKIKIDGEYGFEYNIFNIIRTHDVWMQMYYLQPIQWIRTRRHFRWICSYWQRWMYSH